MTAHVRSLKVWRFNLFVGVLFLAACLSISRFLSLPFFDGVGLIVTIRESIGIIGWVALWEPANFILYGRRENMRSITAYIRLYLAETEFAVYGS